MLACATRDQKRPKRLATVQQLFASRLFFSFQNSPPPVFVVVVSRTKLLLRSFNNLPTLALSP